MTATGVTPDQVHAQHIHGLFDGDGAAVDSVTPTLADDANKDGMVEVLEGVGQYGDVLPPLDDDGEMPTVSGWGTYTFIQSYDLDDDSLFGSPVTGNDYTSDDILPLALREIVIHGIDVPDGIGAGTGNDVDGGTNGYTGILPTAAGEIERAGLSSALSLADRQKAAVGANLFYGTGAQTFEGTVGDDRVSGGAGIDSLSGDDDSRIALGGDFDVSADGGDTIFGGAGNDEIHTGSWSDADNGLPNAQTGRVSDWAGGGADDDRVRGGNGADLLNGDDSLYGADGDDLLVGNGGDDVIFGGPGLDIIGGGSDRITGGTGADEFHFDAGTGSDIVMDFTPDQDEISLLDGGAIESANSSEDAAGGDSDLSADDFDFVFAGAALGAGNDRQVVVSSGGIDEAMATTGAAVEAYVAANDGTDTQLWYDNDWSTAEGRELIATLEDFSGAMTVSDFDVYQAQQGLGPTAPGRTSAAGGPFRKGTMGAPNPAGALFCRCGDEDGKHRLVAWAGVPRDHQRKAKRRQCHAGGKAKDRTGGR
ncbi:hypothetical protein ATI53_106714 [Salipiger aestuarii]|uniref:Hemolysin type calcium-binding protein n=1 Tax=Salipiger aestuarii TaxID=568098 RepID=A0A327XN51_9RHOB|nr:hypothetical protein ATI53_106714 [Salipiger aestuarii]